MAPTHLVNVRTQRCTAGCTLSWGHLFAILSAPHSRLQPPYLTLYTTITSTGQCMCTLTKIERRTLVPRIGFASQRNPSHQDPRSPTQTRTKVQFANTRTQHNPPSTWWASQTGSHSTGLPLPQKNQIVRCGSSTCTALGAIATTGWQYKPCCAPHMCSRQRHASTPPTHLLGTYSAAHDNLRTLPALLWLD